MSVQNIIKVMKQMTMMVRPPGPPKVWEVVEKTGKDGQPIKFTIQEIPEDRYEDAIDHMCKYFIADEPTSACFNAINTPIFLEECRTFWRFLLNQGIAIAAFVDNVDGKKPVIAGMNLLCMEYKEKEEGAEGIYFSSKYQITYEVVRKLNKEARLYDRYGVDKYLYAVGLSVAPPFRRYGLGTDLLKVRDKICREYNISMTSTTFTSPFAAKAAQRAGFEELWAKDYIDLVDENGKEYFPGIQKYSKSIVIMAKRIN